MTFNEVLSQTIAMLQQHGRVSYRALQERGNEAYTLRLLGEIAAQHDPPQIGSAEAHYRQAFALADELGMRPLVAHCHLGLGMLYLSRSKPMLFRKALTGW